MDSQYTTLGYRSNQFEHTYGENVYLVQNPVAMSLLVKLGHPSTTQPTINRLVEQLYQILIQEAVSQFFPKTTIDTPTRMESFHEQEGRYRGQVIDSSCQVVSVNLARAGTLPSYICYDHLHYLIQAENIRQDHFICERQTNSSGEVVGVDISGSKIGGEIEDRIVLFPDPMGATGGTLCRAIDAYTHKVQGHPKAIIALHLIVTPEYIQRVHSEYPDVKITALRLDRGLSDPEILASIPGTFPEREVGLNSTQYIVPGAGGLGEILNNAFV